MRGMIFDIQRFSINDGPGIRSTIFLKGCSLKCLWCHNPESINKLPQLQYFTDKCINCGTCIEICPQKVFRQENVKKVVLRKKCLACGKCAEACLSEALELAGKEVKVHEIIYEVMKDKSFYENSEGGITVSGGEPLLQSDFLAEILKGCKSNGLHTAVDTAGNVDWDAFKKIIPYTDLFLYDIKCIDEAAHIKYTGAGNKRILENLKSLSDLDMKIWVRVPVIPEFNCNTDEMERIADFLWDQKNILLVELLPYHNLGEFKHRSLGVHCCALPFTAPSAETLRAMAEIFKSRNLCTRFT